MYCPLAAGTPEVGRRAFARARAAAVDKGKDKDKDAPKGRDGKQGTGYTTLGWRGNRAVGGG